MVEDRYIVTEFCDTILTEQRSKLNTKSTIEICLGIAEGIKYLHQRKIIHCDLKPENIALKSNEPKIFDFGIARFLCSTSTLGQRCFTPDYASPEVLNGDPVSFPTDIYSFGIILNELITRRPPYEKGTTYRDIKNGTRPSQKMVKDNIVISNLNFLIQSCWHRDPSKRPKIDEISNVLNWIKKQSEVYPDL